MPKFDLAGNPLPEKDSPSTSGLGGSPAFPPPSPSRTRPPLPARQDAQGRTIHAAPPPRPSAPPLPAPPSGRGAGYDLAGNPLPPRAAPLAPPVGPQTPSVGAVRYDLSGNPILSSAAPPPSAAAPPTYYGAPRGGAGVWPPAPAGTQSTFYENTSGQQGELPPEIALLKWNWGAFFFPIFWCKKHGMTTLAAILGGSLVALRLARNFSLLINPLVYVFLLVIYGATYFGVAVYFGAMGHKLGWRNRRFDDVQDYLSCQSKWMWWGFGINVVTSILLPILIFAGLFSLGMSAAHQSSYSNPGSGFSVPAPGDSSSGGSPGNGQ